MGEPREWRHRPADLVPRDDVRGRGANLCSPIANVEPAGAPGLVAAPAGEVSAAPVVEIEPAAAAATVSEVSGETTLGKPRISLIFGFIF